MGRPVPYLVAVLTCVALARETTGAAVILDGLVIRVYDNAGLLAAERARALRRAAELLGRADVAVEWMECGTRKHSGYGACDTPVAGELVVRLIVGPGAATHGPQPLGYSLVDSVSGIGTLATIYVDRVERLASRARADRAEVMGRAIAHEIGHLMLGSNGHTPTGLMRATWTAAEVTRNRREDWQFSPEQRQHLRNARLGSAARRTAAKEVTTPAGG